MEIKIRRHSPPRQVDVLPLLALQRVSFAPVPARRRDVANAAPGLSHQLLGRLVQLPGDWNVSKRLKKKTAT